MTHDDSPLVRICERCYTPIENDEEFVSLAHIDRAGPDGSIGWRYAFVHTTVGATRGSGAGALPCGLSSGTRGR